MRTMPMIFTFVWDEEKVCNLELDFGDKADEAGARDEENSVDVSTDAEDDTE